MTSILPWLPKDALEPAHFERAISEVVAEWSSHWFTKTKASCRIRLRDAGNSGTQHLAWRSWGGECGVSLDESGRLALAEAMLDRSIAANAVQPADRPLLTDMTDRCVDDLLGRISWLIDRDRGPELLSDALEPEAGMSWTISLRRSGATFGLVLNRSALVRWRKLLAPKAATPALARVATALRSQPVEVALELGRGSLTVAELENLSTGDVVILDRPVDAPLGILAAGAQIGISGRLKQQDQSIQVDIIESKRAKK